MNQNVQLITIDGEREGQRIDNFLIAILKGVPKTRIYRILRKGEVRVNKGRVKASYRLKRGDEVRIPPIRLAEARAVEPKEQTLELIHNSILFEDNSILVLNKPAGIAVHGGSGISYGVIEAVRVLMPKHKNLELVHRLDRDTSGCLLIAKKRSILKHLHQQMQSNRVIKRYIALVQGQWPEELREVAAPLRKNTLQSGERIVRVDEQGKDALSLFQVKERFERASLVEIELKTGRTHQIRVHCQYAQHPIMGDDKYGDKSFNQWAKNSGLKRLYLHARELIFQLPERDDNLRITAPLDQSFQKALKVLRNEQ